MINFHYALQTCDIAVRDDRPRYCGASKSEITKKCVTSFFQAVDAIAKIRTDTSHNICIFDDHSTNSTVEYLKLLSKIYSTHNVTIEFISLYNFGIMNSIGCCYEYLKDNGKDFVYQVQDDYLFEKVSLIEMTDIWFQIYNMTNGKHSIISPYNHTYYWNEQHFYNPSPRVLIYGNKRHWINVYEIPCTYFTTHKLFVDNWDLNQDFLLQDPHDSSCESKTLFKIVRDRGNPCFVPINSTALHMQFDLDKDPYIDWQERWENVLMPKLF